MNDLIFLTGATGFVGRALTARLLERGVRVRALARPRKRRPLWHHPNLSWIEGDLLAPDSFRAGLDGATGVIHLVGILAEGRFRTYDRVHRQGTETMLTLARAAGVRRYLQMSALGARPDAPSGYHRSKWAAEQAVHASGLAYTIFRPSLIYGAGDRLTTVFARVIDWSPVVPLIGPGRRPQQPIWVEDVVRYFLTALEQPQTVGRVYELGGPEQLGLRHLIERLLRVKAKRRPIAHLPMGLMRAQAALLQALLPAPPLTPDVLVMLEEDNVVTDPAAARDFRFQPAALDQILPQYLLRRSEPIA